jgi:DNA-binding CsgD family transcriptional regulator
MVAHNWGLPELVESAVRCGRRDLANDALQRLNRKATASGTAWGLGIEARARALLSDGDTAEVQFRAAVDHLSRAHVHAERARTHLLYGEWLRRTNRRTAARQELHTAYDMFTAMGMQGFARRAHGELVTTGATVHGPAAEARHDLTPQEAHIARLARDGLSNPEIAAQLFISARTVEWHLRKVFTKLGVTSRRQLRTLSDSGRTVPST